MQIQANPVGSKYQKPRAQTRVTTKWQAKNMFFILQYYRTIWRSQLEL